MSILYLTIFLSLVLVSIFVAFFIHFTSKKERSSLEQDALMPLRGETLKPFKTIIKK